MYVCVCQAVTEGHIAQAVESGADSMKQLRRHLGVATECGRCANCARDCLKQSLATRREAGAQAY